ncbi:hypothetical protein GA0115261_1031413, partial [Streptomyces sp. OspMP-M43]
MHALSHRAPARVHTESTHLTPQGRP